MNIIMVCESALVSGGAEKVAIQEAIELTRRGHQVGFIAANDLADPGLESAGVSCLLLDTRSFFEETNRKAKFQKLMANPAIGAKVQQFLSKYEPKVTVVHLHTFRLKLSGIVAHIAQQMGFRTVLHGHDYSTICPTSLLFDHRTGTNCDRRPMSQSCLTCECQNQAWKYKLPKLTSFFWNQTVWRINQKSGGIIHISELERATTERALARPIPGFSVPPISGFHRVSRIEAEKNQNLLFVGRLTHEKGVLPFLEVCSRLNVPAVVLGDGPLKESLQTQFPNARFAGWLDADAILAELNQSRALIVPSLWRETLCLSVIDAMHVGVPCVVSETVGAKDYIESGVSGIVYPPDDLDEAIGFLSDDLKVAKMSEGAFARFVTAPMTVQHHVDQLIAVYQSVLEAKP